MTLVTIYTREGTNDIVSTLDAESVVQTRIFAGKNQPYSGVEVTVVSNIFSDSDSGVWDPISNPRPIIVNGDTTIDVDTYGTVKGYVITNVSNDDSHTIITAYHPAYRLDFSIMSDVFNKLFKVKKVHKQRFNNVKDSNKNQPAWAIFSSGLGPDIESMNSTIEINGDEITLSDGELAIASDAYRSFYGKGCQREYQDTLADEVLPGYSNPPRNISEVMGKVANSSYEREMYDLSKYTSGPGYEGLEYKNTSSTKIDSDNPSFYRFTYWLREDEMDLIFHINVVDVTDYSVSNAEPKYTSRIEWIEGRSDDIVRFILKYISDKTPYPQYFTRATMYYPDPNSPDPKITDEVQDGYKQNILEDAVNIGPVLMDSEQTASGAPSMGYPIGAPTIENKSTERIRIRVEVELSCGKLIDNLANLTNRNILYSDEGFFMTGAKGDYVARVYTETGTGDVEGSDLSLDRINGLLLDPDPRVSEEINNITTFSEETIESPTLQDNGEGYTISSQSVEADNYKATIYNIDTKASKAGSVIFLPFSDAGVGLNLYRNRMAKICAYNTLVERFKFENNIMYGVSEFVSIPPSYNPRDIDSDNYSRTYFLSMDELISFKSLKDPEEGDIAIIDDGLIEEIYKCTNTGAVEDVWTILDSEDEGISGDVLIPKHPLYAVSKEIRDNFNGITLHNAPIGLIVRSYPEYTTSLLWGNSDTMDLIAQTKDLQDSVRSSSTSGNEDTKISNKFASRLVVGNMTLDELANNNDSRHGYTGLIMEKNVGSALYRLSGYNNGTLQAEFDSKGRITAGTGDNRITMDERGLVIGDADTPLDDTIGPEGPPGPATDTGEYVILNNSGISVVDNNVIRTAMNRYGFVVSPATESSNSGAMVLNEFGLIVSPDRTYNINGANVPYSGRIVINEKGMVISPTNHSGTTIMRGRVALNEFGLIAGSDSAYYDSDRYKGKVILNEYGLIIGPTHYNSSNIAYNGKVMLKDDGLTAGSGDDRVTINENGIRLGNYNKSIDEKIEESTPNTGPNVSLNNAGISVHRGSYVKTLMNQYGFILNPSSPTNVTNNTNYGDVILNENGIFLGPTNYSGGVATQGRVSLTNQGLYAGKGDKRILINENGLYMGGVNVDLDSMQGPPGGDGDWYPGPHIIINNTGMSVYKDNIYKTVMNGAGFIAGPNGGLPTSQYGDVVLNQHGLIVGPGSEYNAKNGRGDVTLKNDGLTLYSGASDGDYIEERAVKFRGLGSSSIEKDLARIYTTQHNIGSDIHHTLNISTYNKKNKFGLGSIKIGNVDSRTISDEINTGWASGFTTASPQGFKTIVGNISSSYVDYVKTEKILCEMVHINSSSVGLNLPDWVSKYEMHLDVTVSEQFRLQILLDGKQYGELIEPSEDYETIKIDLIKYPFTNFAIRSIRKTGTGGTYVHLKNMKFILRLDEGGSIEVSNYRTEIGGKFELTGFLHGDFRTSKAARISLGMDEKSGFSDSVTLTSATANTVYRTGEKSEVVSVIRNQIYLYIATCSDINKSNRKIIYTMQNHTNANGWTTAIGVIPPHTYYYFGDNDADHKYYIRSCTRDL